MESIVYNTDCLEYMKTLPDKAFDLAIVDPPYGDALSDFKRSDKSRFGGHFDKYKECGHAEREREREKACGTRIHTEGGGWARRYNRREAEDGTLQRIEWDVAPPQEYFEQLFRVSKNQVIWGGNYFTLPPTRCFLIWRKLTISEDFTMAMAEYAWTNFNDNAKVFEFAPQGKKDDKRFHPTQKPVALYEWILSRFAKKGDRILDTHLGSGSSRIACAELGFDFVGCEIDKTYYELQEKRFKEYSDQLMLF